MRGIAMGNLTFEIPWLVVLLLVILAFICVFSWLQKGKPQRRNCEQEPCKDVNCKQTCKESCNTLLKKENTYRLIILVVVLVFVLGYTFSGNSDAMGYFSFASTITSIILSVIAIIMTINNEQKSDRVKDAIDESVKTLQQSTEELKEYSESMGDVSEKLETVLSDIHGISEKTEEMNQHFSKIQNRNERYNPSQTVAQEDGEEIWK